VKTAVWSLFSAGHPQVVGCASGAARHVALILWATYSLLSATVLLNLLIGLLSATMSALQETKLETWKYYRTQVMKRSKVSQK